LLMSPLPIFDIWAGDVRSVVLLCLLLIVMDTPMPMAIDLAPGSSSYDETIQQRGFLQQSR
jgi:hypothetical protein